MIYSRAGAIESTFTRSLEGYKRKRSVDYWTGISEFYLTVIKSGSLLDNTFFTVFSFSFRGDWGVERGSNTHSKLRVRWTIFLSMFLRVFFSFFFFFFFEGAAQHKSIIQQRIEKSYGILYDLGPQLSWRFAAQNSAPSLVEQRSTLQRLLLELDNFIITSSYFIVLK